MAAWASGGPAYSWSGIAISGNTKAHALNAVSGILHAPQPVPIPRWGAWGVLIGTLLLAYRALPQRSPA